MKYGFLIIAAMLSSTLNAEIIWTYGVDDNSQRGRNNANEFSSTAVGGGQENFYHDYFGMPGRIDTNNNGIGYLNDNNQTFLSVCNERGMRCRTHSRDYKTAVAIAITILNQSQKTCTNLQLRYDRHGTESDIVLFLTDNDGENPFLTFVGAEGAEARSQQLDIAIPDKSIDPNEEALLQIGYAGSGKDNGHFIDYIELSGDCAILP